MSHYCTCMSMYMWRTDHAQVKRSIFRSDTPVRGRTSTLPDPYFYFAFLFLLSPKHTRTHTHTQNNKTTKHVSVWIIHLISTVCIVLQTQSGDMHQNLISSDYCTSVLKHTILYTISLLLQNSHLLHHVVGCNLLKVTTNRVLQLKT